MIEIRLIDKAHCQDINIPNEPFRLYGRLLPSYTEGKWNYQAAYFAKEEVSEMCFPDENYDYEKMCADHIFVGAYDGETCIGLAMRLLIIEDNKELAASMKQGLEKAGFHIDVSHSV